MYLTVEHDTDPSSMAADVYPAGRDQFIGDRVALAQDPEDFRTLSCSNCSRNGFCSSFARASSETTAFEVECLHRAVPTSEALTAIEEAREVYWFRSAKEAKAEMKIKNDQICAFGINNTAFGDEIRTIRECVAILEPYGEYIYDAVHHYVTYLKAQAKIISIKLMSEKVRVEFRRQLECGEKFKGGGRAKGRVYTKTKDERKLGFCLTIKQSEARGTARSTFSCAEIEYDIGGFLHK